PVTEPDRLLLDRFRRLDRAAAEAPLEIVDVRSREAGVRRSQEAVQLAPAAAAPREPQQREQRLPEQRLRQRDPSVDRVWDAERPEGRFEWRAVSLDRRADDGDPLG